MSDEKTADGVHPVPLGLLAAVWGALSVLTLLTVLAAQADLGALNIWVALGIATLKASLVALFFMHLFWERGFNAFLLCAALAFVTLFIGITLLDSEQYQPDKIPDYAPALRR